MPILSFRSVDVVKHINQALQRNQADTGGWMLYTLVRMLLFGALCYLVVTLRSAGDPESALAELPVRERRRVPSYDPLLGLRVLAALMVFLGHYFLVVFAYRTPASGPQFVLQSVLQSSPWAGVWVFFTLSGYLMGKGFATGRYQFTPASVFAFYRNRALRIAPLYFGATLLVALLTDPLIFHPGHWWELGEICTFDYSGNLPDNPIGALWSVSTEVQFYFLVPFLFPVVRKLREAVGGFTLLLPLALCMGAAFRWWLGQKYQGGYWFYGYAPLLPNLDLFLVGMGLTQLAPTGQVPERRRNQLRFVFPFAGVAIFLGSAFCTVRFYQPGQLGSRLGMFEFLPGIVSLLSAAYILAAQAVGRVPLGSGTRGVLHRVVTRVGFLTYAIYILHAPVFGSFRTTLPSVLLQQTSFVFFPLLVVLVWLLSEGAYRYIEEPFERQKHLPIIALAKAP